MLDSRNLGDYMQRTPSGLVLVARDVWDGFAILQDHSLARFQFSLQKKREWNAPRATRPSRAASHSTQSTDVGIMPMVLRILAAVLLATSALAQINPNAVPEYKPVTAKQRFHWFAVSSVGPTSILLPGPISAAWGTAFNKPPEYGPHWEGFADRYGMRLSGVSTGNAIEASLGAVLGEDPRYFRSPDHAFGSRVKYVVRTTFTAPGLDGRWRPAYARYAGNLGNNFLSNRWRVHSENGVNDAARRCIWGITGKMAANAFSEFWPDVKKLVFRKWPPTPHPEPESNRFGNFD